jgi:hypothetical protein
VCIWAFATEEHTLYAVRESRGSDVPAEVLGEDFAETVVCDGWTAYPAFSSELQRCWAHIHREVGDVAEKEAEGEAIYHALRQLYVALQAQLESELTVRERAELQRVARRGVESLIERSVPDRPVATLLRKLEDDLDHWLTFVGEPAVSPTNNTAENALREPVVLQKMIGTLRNDCGMLFMRQYCPYW